MKQSIDEEKDNITSFRDTLQEALTFIKSIEVQQERSNLMATYLFNEELFEQLSARLVYTTPEQLQAGLALIVADLEDAINARKLLAGTNLGVSENDTVLVNIQTFQEIVGEIKTEDAHVTPEASYTRLKDDPNRPHEFSEALAGHRGRVSDNIIDLLDSLSDPVYMQAALPGKRILHIFLRKLHDQICKGNNSIYHKVKSGEVKVAAVGLVVGKLIGQNFTTDSMWLPMITYVTVLLAQAGLNTYCEGDDKPPKDNPPKRHSKARSLKKSKQNNQT